MKKKLSGIVVALLLFIQSLFGVSALTANANASASVQEAVYGVTDDVYAPSAPVTNTDSILTKVVLTDMNGTVIDAVYNPDSTLDIGEAVNLSYEWELPNGHGYKNGDTFSFDLPSQFEIFTDIDAPLVTDQGEVGRFTVDRDGKVVMTFNDYVESHSNVSGKLEIRTEFTKETIKGSTEVIIAFPVKSGVQTVIVNLKPQGGKLIDKQGKAVGKDRIDWAVQVNKSLDKIKHAVITDAMPEGSELIADSVEVYRLQVNGDGSTVLGDKVEAGQYTVETNGGAKLELAFQDETISKAYEIRFSTKLTGEQSRFENTAVLSGDGMEDSKSTATVTVNRGQFLDKSYRQDKDTGIITWTVKYNFNEKKIPRDQAVITDEFSAIHTLVTDSLKVYNGNSTDAKDVLSTNEYTVTPVGTNGFTLQFEKDIDSPYTIVYQTKPVDRTSADGKEVKNEVRSGGTTTGATAPAQGIRALEKGTWKVDFANKTATWGITVNGDKKPDGSKYSMENVVIKDTFPQGGLEFVPGSVIVKADGKIVPASDYKVEYDQNNLRGGFVIKFSKTIDTTYTIEYQTKFNIDWLEKRNLDYMNRASMTWSESDGTTRTIERDASFASDNYTKNNGGKDGSYNPVSKEITWNIKMNYNLDSLDDAIVKDVLKHGQKLVPNSVKVYEMKLTGGWNGVAKGAPVPASQYELTEPSAANGNQLSIHFTSPVKSAYWIEFKTSLQGELILKNIDNTAELWNGSDKEATWNGSVTVPHGGEYVEKSGAQNGNKIDWSIRINEGQSHISNAKVIDYPSPNQILIEDSFHLYATKVSANGEAVKAEELTKGKDYTLTITRDEGDQETFELKFTNAISTAYILEYQSFITAGDKEAVQNKVALEGDQLKTEIRETTEEVIVRTSSGSGSGGGVTGSLQVTKVDEDDAAKTLAGAKFALYDKAGKGTPIVKTTDADGKILFAKLLYGDYILEELAAPEGYTVEQATWSVKIDSSIQSQGNVKKMTVTNHKEEPVEPGEPSNPTDPTDPTEPGNPGNPTDPGNPGNPTDPGGPSNPGSPGNPSNPSNPGTPGGSKDDDDDDNDPGLPPSTPSNPGTPSDPGTPSNPGTPPGEVEVPDEDTPRGEPTTPQTPSTGEPEIPTVDIDEEDTPRGEGEQKPETQKPKPQTPTSETQVSMLPQTGEASRYPFYLAGLGLIALGVWLGRKRNTMKQ
ncbi:SpaA isopeptide-forming pilin-related protein [Paenibacillus sp. P96]|uniref:SpaA isopeptide-forming pilin-related protein n=2 Tax=Paenibacillus zeirhizosphaerae TaxID=2987519 RepID=A0ABT9FNS8_9BACL|nr:collagen binding domain-containing protein [Paenibacillus sp. P96]MDP4096381.1 SpaA isopeptide-forming pilin-related protein [Paenibacillus sp. P96]